MTADDIAVSKLPLSCGIKCRYLGRFATLAVAEERKYLVAQKYVQEGQLSKLRCQVKSLCWLEIMQTMKLLAFRRLYICRMI